MDSQATRRAPADTNAAVVTVPGLRGRSEEHWQTRLARTTPNVIAVEAIGRDRYDLDERVAMLEEVLAGIQGPVTIVAHSAGVLTTVHWAARRDRPINGALLATPPDLASPLPPEYPSLQALHDSGWLPIPLERLPFPSIVAASANDSLGDPTRIGCLAAAWGSELVPIGPVGHLNPASGYGEWPLAQLLVDRLTRNGRG